MASRPLITERMVRDAVREGRSELAIPRHALITPLARDTAKDFGLRLTTTPEAPGTDCGCEDAPASSASVQPGTVAIGCDHAGFEIKSALADHARALGWTVRDLGTDSSESVDYPDFAYAVARTVTDGTAVFGVMIDGVGVGSAMVANKVPGVRAACCGVEFAAYNARAHNDANVLTLGSRTVGVEANKRILEVFLKTVFEGGRHAKRVDKIADVEKRMKG